MVVLWWLVSCEGNKPDPTGTDVDADADADADSDTDSDTDTDADTDTDPTWADIPLDTGAPGFGILINELLSDVGGGLLNDANCDGQYGFDDQFIEIVNIGTVDIALAGSTIEHQGLSYRQFPEGYVLAAGHAVVLFSGGAPSFEATSAGEEPWCQPLPETSEVQLLDRPLDLPECGGYRVVLVGPIGFVLDAIDIGEGDCTGASLVRSPELDPSASWLPHDVVSGVACSPATRADGAPF